MKILSFNRNYAIDKKGNVYSRIFQFSQKGKQGIQTQYINAWKLLKGSVTKKGRLQVRINNKSYFVHRLLAEEFIPNPNNYPEVQHRNDIPTDNRIENLKWGTQKDNAQDRENNGHWFHGETSPNAKLTNAQAEKIRRDKQNKSLNELSKEYGISKKAVLLIIQNKTYRKEEINETI